MSIRVLTAITGHREASLVAALDAAGTALTVTRRCADLADLLAAAAAGYGEAVVVSADLERLDREAVGRLRHGGLVVVALATGPGEEQVRAGRLGVDAVLAADVPARALVETVRSAVGGRVAVPDDPPVRPLLGDPAAAVPLRAAEPPPAPPPVDDPDRPPGQVVVVWGPTGAPGRTTVAVTLAACLARHAETLLVDADTHGAGVAQSLGLLDESAGIAAAARAANQGALDAARLLALTAGVSPGLRVLTGLPQPRRWPELRPGALDEVWSLARSVAGFVVVDAGFGLEADEELMFDVAVPRRHGSTLSALAAADRVVAVGAGEPVGIQRLLAALPDLERVVPPEVPRRVVMTRVRESAVGRPAEALVARALERFAGVTDPVLLPDERDAFDAAMLAGRAVTEHRPDARAVALLGELAAELAGGTVPAAPPVRRLFRRRRTG